MCVYTWVFDLYIILVEGPFIRAAAASRRYYTCILYSLAKDNGHQFQPWILLDASRSDKRKTEAFYDSL